MEIKVLGYTGGLNAGGLLSLTLIPIEQVLDIIDPQFYDYAVPFTVPTLGLPIAEGAQVTRIAFPPGAASFVETSATGPEGVVYSVTLEATIPRNERGLLDFLSVYQGRKWLAIFSDRNGLAYVAGEPERGLSLTISRAIDKTNAVTLTLGGRNVHPVWFLETADLNLLFAPAEFDLAFDFSFNAKQSTQWLYRMIARLRA